MQSPLISVALCTYNGAKYLPEQMDSILGQSLQNIEIIIADDRSADDTQDIIKNYAEKDPRIKYFINESNLGFNKNFEKAISLTSGELIAISDQDDTWLPDKLRLLADNIGDNWLIFSNSAFVGDGGGLLLNNFKLPDSYKGILFYNYVTGHTSLMRRELLKLALPFPQKGYYDWWLGFVASYHKKIGYLDEVLTQHRVHTQSVIQQRIALVQAEKEEFETVSVMLNEFATYQDLADIDKAFVNEIKAAYALKGSGKRSMPLLRIIFEHYPELFPNLKARGLFSKLNFALKFSRGIRS
jgi:glycosyltransferase involved in cell wall biosynthesis